MCASTILLCSHTIVLICINNKQIFSRKAMKYYAWVWKTSYLCIVKQKE